MIIFLIITQSSSPLPSLLPPPSPPPLLSLLPIVPPAIPVFHSVSTTPFQASVSFNHTNLTTDDAPNEIVLTLTDQHESLINTVTIPGHRTQHTFIGLTPSTQYTVSISVSNIDKEIEGGSITLTTATTGTYIITAHCVITNCLESCLY